MTEASYGIPSGEDGTLPWSFVEETLAGERNYWVTTIRPDGRPHARPTWGVWVDGRFHCGGGARTRWVRNLAADPAIVVHTESAESVVVVEGVTERIDAGVPERIDPETADRGDGVDDPTTTDERVERLDDAYEVKYGIRHGTPFFAVHPERVLAWNDYPTDATRWRFDRV